MIVMGALPQTPGIWRSFLPEWMILLLLLPPFESGMDGGLTTASS